MKWNKMRSRLEAKMSENPASMLGIGGHRMTGEDSYIVEEVWTSSSFRTSIAFLPRNSVPALGGTRPKQLSDQDTSCRLSLLL